MDGEEEEIEGRGARGEEWPPPPAIVLRAEVEIAEEDGGLGTDNHQNKECQHDESKHVVHLTRPAVLTQVNMVNPSIKNSSIILIELI